LRAEDRPAVEATLSGLRIPVAPVARSALHVYFSTDGPAPDVLALARPSLAAVEDPLRASLAAYVVSDLVDARVAPRGASPDPSRQPLDAFGFGAEEARRYDAATHVCAVPATFGLKAPLLHVWAAELLAYAVADAVGGVIVDALVPRVFPLARRPTLPPA